MTTHRWFIKDAQLEMYFFNIVDDRAIWKVVSEREKATSFLNYDDAVKFYEEVLMAWFTDRERGIERSNCKIVKEEVV